MALFHSLAMGWKFVWVFFCLCPLVFLPGAGQACTLWAAAGVSVVGEGTMIAKNRDWVPDHRQKMEWISPKGGYRYVGLVAVGSEFPGLRAGVNEKGLVVVTASPPRYLEKNRHLPREKGLIRKILIRCKNVQEAVSHGEWFVGPRFMMMADAQEVVSVEIGLKGQFKVQRTQAGVLSHTNHYLEPEFCPLNPDKPYVSSRERLEQIQQFLSSKKSFDLSDYRTISQSQHNGPDNSIWRTGSSPRATRTLATWIVHQPFSGKAVLYVRLANPGEEIEEKQYFLPDLFDGKEKL